jgi:ankyrin repeat protein
MTTSAPETIAEMLIKAGADPNAHRPAGLDSAALCGGLPVHRRPNLEALRYLIQAGADPTILDMEGRAPLEIATRAGCADAIGILADHLQKLNQARQKAKQAPWKQPPAASQRRTPSRTARARCLGKKTALSEKK